MSLGLRTPGGRVVGGGASLVALALGLVLAPVALEAQPRPERPSGIRDYAITNARIVTVSGPTLERGTVVVSDGVITAVGANVAVPPEAWVVDGAGKMVYPGFFDAMSTLGHPRARGQQTGFAGFGNQGGGDGPHSWGPEDRPGTHTWVSAADELDAADARFASWRNAGFTTAVSTRDQGLVPGQAAVLSLGLVERAREMVVATPVAMRVTVQDRSYSGYPNSLMGGFAYLKQLYLDAQYYDRVWTDYASDPRGKARPEWDLALEPLREQMAGQYPVLFPANDRVQAGRAVETAAVMGVPVVIYGMQRGWEAADMLAAAGAPVLVDVDWPEPPRDADPEAEPSLEMLRLWDRAATTPAALADAGVRFAFYGGADASASGILEGVRAAVAQGLGADAAVRALTLTPAEIFGVADRLGSVEVGKIANLVVASGDITADGTRVETVFVDGDKIDVPPPGNGRGGRTADADDGADAAEPVAMARDRGPYRTDPVTLIRNATILTASDGTLENGSILIRDGRIAAVGTDVQAPSGAHIVDASGRYVTPGIIDAHSHMAADAINEGAVNVSAMVGIKDVLNPTDVGIYRALAGGVTTINILHGSANPVGGQNAVMKLRWGGDKDDVLIAEAHPGIKFALGENTKRDRNPDRYPATRMGVQDVVRQVFMEARRYQAGWDEWNATRQGVEPRRDLKLEAMAEILRGDRWVHSHSYRADEILQLIRLAEEQGFTVRTFQHVLEGYKVADEIAAHGAGASTFSDWWAYKVEAYDAIPHNAALMTERGVLTSINSDSGEEIRHLNQEAAKAMKWGGLDEEAALRLVTLNPAIQLGIDDRVGSIEVGKDADLAIFDGPPLSMFAKVEQTYVDGMLYFDIELDRERQAAIEAEKSALLERYGASGSGAGTATDRIAPGPDGQNQESHR
ncbi:MAG: amidohydrolase family protein [Longimicrobiales bacterium]